MGRHSIDYHPEQGDSPAPSSEHALPDSSIAPPGGPIDPAAPGAPDAPNGPSVPDNPSFPDPGPSAPDPGPSAPQPEPGSPEITPSEPPPFAPDEAGDGAVPVGGSWHAAGDEVL